MQVHIPTVDCDGIARGSKCIDDLPQASGTRDAILINDHGNVTLYTPTARIGYAREIMTEVWSGA